MHNLSKTGLAKSPFQYFLLLIDIVTLEGAYAFAYATVPIIRRTFFHADTIIDPGVAAGFAILIPIIWLVILTVRDLYEDPARASLSQTIQRLLQTTVLGLGALILVLFAVKQEEVSRLLLFIFGIYSFLALFATRVVIKVYFTKRHRSGYYIKKSIMVGAVEDVNRLGAIIASDDVLYEYHVVGYIRIGSAADGAQARVPALGGIENLSRELARREVSEVLVIWDAHGTPELDCVLQTCREVGTRVRLIPRFALNLNAVSPPNLSVHAEILWGLPSITLSTLKHKPEQEFIKRLMDIVISAILLVALSPLFLMIALAIRLTSPGPILYRWKVLGRNNREFVGYKFRTMVVNADELKSTLLPLNEMQGVVFKMKNDPRVTPLGRFLRKYSLDELPQLWSVLKGDMSLVGPRPVFRSEFERFQFWQMRKLSVRPGITCLWQVNGRNEIRDMNDWISLDLKYIDNWTLGLDLKILAKTALVVLRGTGH